jgi:hypothetical protein
MEKQDINDYYDEVLKRLNHYTKFHIEIIKLIIPEIKKYREAALDFKNLSKYYIFDADFLVKESGFNAFIVVDVLNDFVVDGLLAISARLPDATVYVVTDKGYYCLDKIIDLHKE